MKNYDKLQATLREIFEMDKADLDFGIYRIMNQKRDEVNKFINDKLPKEINDILSKTITRDKLTIENELSDLANKLDVLGMVKEDSPKYLELERRLAEATDITALESEVFSHLSNFFKRYYKDGDFISMRRYKKDVYAIPYEGEEVKLHWANHDQYYIKTSEYLKNYSFKLGTKPEGEDTRKTVHFRLKEASTEQNNNKSQDGERRFAIYDDMPVEVEDGMLYINFTYEVYKKSVKQNDLEAQAVKVIEENIPIEFVSICEVGSAATEKNKKRTLLEKHIGDFISRNTFDYFIHKDLGAFLNRELDFYIKNEVLYLDDIDTENSEFFVAQLSKMKAIKSVARKIISFLAQVEDFQKKLWLKKKFVVRTDYCITLDKIPEVYYPEIASNEAQLAEWKQLFDVAINNVEELHFEPYLVLDTKFFSEEFKDKLLGEFDNLDEETDGVLINSENFQALNLMQEKYKDSVNTVHIDPPYNTNTSGFLYKNSFKSSSWMSFMLDRVKMSIRLLNSDGSFICHIDENEYERLYLLLDHFHLFNSGTIVWDKRNPMTGGAGIAIQHEYIIWKNKNNSTININTGNLSLILSKVAELKDKWQTVTVEVEKEYIDWLNSQSGFSGGEKAYRFIDKNWNVYQSVSLRAPEKREDKKFHIPLIHPITNKPCAIPPNGFSRTPETLAKMITEDLILFGEDETTQPRQKMILKSTKRQQMTSVIQDAVRGKSDLDKLGLEFPYNHSVQFYEYLIDASIPENYKMVLDYFAGSGTTGHATIKLNREDGGNRKYILVEMGTYFNTVTKPRIQKVIYSDNWRNGKPQDKQGISQMFKYQVLESYEDTLNNLILKQSDSHLQFTEDAQENYLLNYMLDMESREHLFDISIFKNPFDYQLRVTENNELIPTSIDLVETFNYLIGLYVQRIQRQGDIKFVEGITRDGKKTLIVWRNTETVDNSEVQRVFRKLYESVLTHEFEQIYINGDHHFQNYRVEEDVFKVKLIEEEFFKRMFEE